MDHKEEFQIDDCPVASIRKLIQGKWSMVIICLLRDQTLRFSEIKKCLPQVADANLTKDLRMLEEFKIIHREVYPVVPPKVEYSLTELGIKFLPVLDAIEIWLEDYKKMVTD